MIIYGKKYHYMSYMPTQNIKQAKLLYSETVFLTLAYVGIVIKLFFGATPTVDGTTGPASSNIWGYGLVLVAVFGLMYVQYAFLINGKDKLKAITSQNDPGSAKSQLNNLIGGTFSAIIATIPTLFIITSIMWLIYLNVTHFIIINQGRVSNEYNKYSTASTIMIVLQLFLLGKELYEEKIVTEGSPSEKISAQSKLGEFKVFAYLLGILSLIFVLMQNIVLTYFTTDG